jgi:hypothetical protein
MKRILLCLVITALISTMVTVPSMALGGSLGAGLHYLHNLGDIDANGTDLSKESFGLIGSYKFGMAMMTLEAQGEYIFNYAGSDEAMFIPSGWALLGSMVYAGAGMGIGHIDGEWQSDPFYALRAGVNLPLMAFKLDLYGTYNFWSNEDIKNATGDDLDSVTFAAVLHF